MSKIGIMDVVVICVMLAGLAGSGSPGAASGCDGPEERAKDH